MKIWLLLILGMVACGERDVTPKKGEIFVTYQGHECSGTTASCLAKFEELGLYPAKTLGTPATTIPESTAKALDLNNPETEEICGGQCKTRCANGADCCGDCPGCTDFCDHNGGSAPKKKAFDTAE